MVLREVIGVKVNRTNQRLDDRKVLLQQIFNQEEIISSASRYPMRHPMR